jgi:hypothetical protein
MMTSYGSISFATEFARGIAGSARHAFDAVFADVPESAAAASSKE